MSQRRIIKIIFHSFVLAYTVMPLFYLLEDFHDQPSYLQRAFLVRFTLMPFYLFNIFVLAEKFLKKEKYIPYILLVLASFITYSSLMITTINSWKAKSQKGAELSLQEKSNRQGLNKSKRFSHSENRIRPKFSKHRKRLQTRFFMTFLSLPLIMITALGTCFEIILDLDQQRRRNKEIELERVGAELSFLKTQMNPHFIFNTLNNIYSLAAIKSDDTEKAILLLSNMMRYILYESSADKIPIRKEIRLIEDYIELQKIRLSDHRNIDIQFNYDISFKSILIEPMLFLPLIENAFKHGISYQENSFIRIHLELKAHELILQVDNTKPKFKKQSIQPNEEDKVGGIGLKNIRKRLQLSYPNHHFLRIEEKEDVFHIYLSLNLLES